MFGATSPLEGVNLAISEAASSNQKATVLLVIDVRRAYFYANTRRRVHIEPAERRQRKTKQSAVGCWKKLETQRFGPW